MTFEINHASKRIEMMKGHQTWLKRPSPPQILLTQSDDATCPCRTTWVVRGTVGRLFEEP